MRATRAARSFIARRASHFAQIVRPWRALRHTPILVYSMGKVGSTSLQVTLRSLGLPNPIFHVHFLSSEPLREAKTCRWGLNPGPVGHLEESKHLRFFADHTWGRVRWQIVTLVREPVAHAVSDLFQNYLGLPQLLGLEGETLADACVEVLRERLAAFDEPTDYVCNWFDLELKTVFEVDVMAAPFDPRVGYATFQGPHADVLLIRLEDLSRCGPVALQAFLGVPRVELLAANERREKATRDAYRRVLQQLTLPVTTLGRIYDSRYTRHFYTPDEIEGFKSRWSQPR